MPRLLLVEAGEQPPDSDDPLEDWIRLPAHDDDVLHRIGVLNRRAASRRRPALDGAGRLLFKGQWIGLSDIDERLMEVLVSHFGEFVDASRLLAGGWDEAPGENALRPHLYRLKRKLLPLGLELSHQRRRGRWMLDGAR